MRPLCVLALAFALLSPGLAAAELSGPRYHVVYSGQRIASIAKRYGVNVDAILNANGLSRRDRIRPGQKLLIPSADDVDGSKARAQNTLPEKRERQVTKAEPEVRNVGLDAAEAGGELSHRVYAGQRLASIAKRYRVSVDELCALNKLDRREKLRPGQILIIPGQAGAAESRESPEVTSTGKGSWHKFAKTPQRKGYVELHTFSRRWQGQTLDRKGRISDKALTSISDLLGAGGNKPQMDARLIKLLIQVSDKFGGRPIRIVSGYRTRSFFKDSRHKTSRAVDFSVPGVPNEVVRDYVRTFRNAGVGYYPNSTFLHLDVREGSTYWVDYAGPGQAPRRDAHRSPGAVQDSEVGEAEVIEQEQRGATAMPSSANDAAPTDASSDGNAAPAPATAEPKEPAAPSSPVNP
jgi:LysM repeat protein/uncharacterized protein YcbK (DUF882 family)